MLQIFLMVSRSRIIFSVNKNLTTIESDKHNSIDMVWYSFTDFWLGNNHPLFMEFMVSHPSVVEN